MKKLLLIISILLILITGCNNVSNDNDDYTEVAVKCALSYLNSRYGYDTDNIYTLKCYLKSEEDKSSRLFVLYENNNGIMFFTLEKLEKDIAIGTQITYNN